jgi:hypothetical protein
LINAGVGFNLGYWGKVTENRIKGKELFDGALFTGIAGGAGAAVGELAQAGIGAAWSRYTRLDRLGRQLDNMAAETQKLIQEADRALTNYHTPDPWLSTSDVPPLGNHAGGFDPHPVPSNVPEGWMQLPDGSIRATPSQMLSGQPPHEMLPPAIEFDPDLFNHLTTVKNLHQRKGVIGGHNRDSFYQYVSNTQSNVRGSTQKLNNITIDSEVPDSIQGLSEIRYSILEGDPRNMGGHIAQYKPVKDPKTVYDSSIISNSRMFELSQDAARKVFVDAIRNQQAVVVSESGGIKFLVYMDLANKRIRNVHPIIDVKK